MPVVDGKEVNIGLLNESPRVSRGCVNGLCHDIASVGLVVKRNLDLEIAVGTRLDPPLESVRTSRASRPGNGRRGGGVSTAGGPCREEQILGAAVRPGSSNGKACGQRPSRTSRFESRVSDMIRAERLGRRQ